MDTVQPLLFGIVQGLTEFLPISSSGHLLLLHSVTHFSVGSDLSFDVALHLGTLVALVVFFWRDLVQYFTAWIKSFSHWNLRTDSRQRIAWLLALSAIPGAVAGMMLESTAETFFRSPTLVAVTLMLAGIALWAADRYAVQKNDVEQLTWKQALLIGLAQAVALVPGVSRSGATIIVGRLLRMTRPAAARFSFLMSVPIIAGAVAKQLFDLRHETFATGQQLEFILAMSAAAVVGYLAIRGLLRYVSHHSYSVFMWYRVALSAVTLTIVWIA